MADLSLWLFVGPLLLCVGAIAGILAGLLGVGGGIVIVPVLYFLTEAGILDVPDEHRVHFAVATSLATIIPTSISSSLTHLRKNSVDLDLFRSWAPFIFAGAMAGGFAAAGFDANLLSAVFGVVALVVALNMLNPRPVSLADAPPNRWVGRAAVAAPIGACSAMMGIGGGTLTVPVLSLLSFPTHRAVGTAALFGLVIAVPGVVGYALAGQNLPGLLPGSVGYVNLPAAIAISAVSIFTAPLGAKIAHRLNARKLRIVFAVFLGLSAVKMLAELTA